MQRTESFFKVALLALIIPSTLFIALPAAAQQANASRIEYNAPNSCPQRDFFLVEVNRRLPEEATPVDVGSIRVGITQTDRGYSGVFHLHDGENITATRRISGNNCDEVVSALALVTALALQAKLALGDEESAVEPTPASQEKPTPKQEALAPSAPANASAPPPPPLEFGLHLGIASIYSAKLNGTLGGFAGLDLSALSVRLWLGYALGQTTHSNTGSAHFDWLGTREEICALSGTHRSLRLGLCGTVELGYLQAKGQSSTSISARSKGTPWLAPGLGVAVRQPLSGGPWRLEFWAGLEFPLTRERFAFRRSDGTLETIHRVPWAGWGSSIGVGYAL